MVTAHKHPPSPRGTGREVRAKNFGAQLVKLRKDESRASVCRAVQKYGIPLDKSTLLHYEAGRVSAPDPAVIWALGRHYGLDDLDDLLTTLWKDRTGRVARTMDIASPGLTNDQRRVAEDFGMLREDLQRAVMTLISSLRAAEAPVRKRKTS